MHVPRLYIPQTLTPGDTLTVSGQSAHHVMHVLRLRAGTVIRVFDGNGHEHDATLQEIGRSDIRVKIGEAIDGAAEPALKITLAQGIARNDRMDLILQKAVELGISEIQPLWMQRSQSHLKGERLARRVQHWQGIIISACEQCGRATLPLLSEPLAYNDWVSAQAEGNLRLMLRPDSELTLKDLDTPKGPVTLLVGPEGGMNTSEQQLASDNNFKGVRLGPRILRTETAALAALTGIQTLWGDFN